MNAAAAVTMLAVVAMAAAGPAGPTTRPATHKSNPKLAGLAPNTVLDLGPLKLTPPAGESSSYVARVTDYSSCVYDRDRRQVLLFGGGHATTFTDAVYAFDFHTLRWTALYPPTPRKLMKRGNFDAALGAWKQGPAGPYPRPASRHTYDLMAVPPGLNELIVCKVGGGITSGVDIGGGGYFGGQWPRYNLKTGKWSFDKPVANLGYGTVEYDPVSKRIVALGRAGFYVYDPVSRKSEKIPFRGPALGYANHMTFYPPNGKLYYFIRKGPVIEVTLDRKDFGKSSYRKLETAGPAPRHGEPGFDYDSASRIIGGAVTNGTFHAFDPAAKRWTARKVRGGDPGSMAFHAIAYDPVDNVFIFIAKRHTWAYKYAPPAAEPKAGQP